MPKKPIKAGLLGRPVSRSLSPAVFSVFSALLGENISYELKDCSPQELEHLIPALAAEGWFGFNITLPYKKEVRKLLNLADPAASACGAVNAARFGRSGLEGMNTDAHALKHALEHSGFKAAGKAAAVFGSGGAAAAAGWALGRSAAAAVTFHARDQVAAGKLARCLGAAFPATDFKTAPFAVPDAATSVFVNATPIGMYAPGLPPCAPAAGQLCADFAYLREGTEFCRAAARAGAAAIDGLDLLVWQAALSLRFWAGLPAGDIVEFQRKARAALDAALKGGS